MGWLIGVPAALAWLALVFTLADRRSARQTLARDAQAQWLYPEERQDDDPVPRV